MKNFSSIIIGLIMFSFSLYPCCTVLADDAVAIKNRIDFIQDCLDQGSVGAKRWQYSWTAVNGAGAFLSAGAAVNTAGSDENEDRHDNMVNSVTFLLGTADLMINPLTACGAGDKLREFKAMKPDALNEQLDVAEGLLRASAEREKKGRSWKTHLMAGAVNALAGIVVASDGGRNQDGLVTFATGMLVAEFQIFTTPTKAIDDLAEYDRRFTTGSRTGNTRHRALENLYVSVGPGSLLFSYLF